MQRAAEPGHRLGAPALDTGVLPSAAARRQTALHAATERITWVRAGWEVAAQRGVACTCDESHQSALLGAAIADPGGLITELATIGTPVRASSALLCSAPTVRPQGYVATR